MTDRSRTGSTGAVSVTATRIGRTDLGQGSAMVDDDALTVVVRGATHERPIRIPLSYVDGAALSQGVDELTLSLRDGTRITLVSPSSTELRNELFAHCRALPELTRALRTFGSRRGNRTSRDSAASDQQRFFAPLLQARRAAGAALTPGETIGAFDAAALSRACEGVLQAFVTERYAAKGPARRALEAELGDLAEPLLGALQALGESAVGASAAVDDLRLWRAWAGQLRSTFEVADRVWMTLDVALDSAPL